MMKTKIIAIISILSLGACTAEAIKTTDSKNSSVKSDLIAVIDDCNIFRVKDGNFGRTFYFAHCKNSANVFEKRWRQAGKTGNYETIQSLSVSK